MTSRGPYRRHSTPFKLQLCHDIRAGLYISDVDVKEPDGVSFEFLALGLVALNIRQTRDAMSLQAPMQR